MGGDSPLASPEPRVLFYGAGAASVARDWNDGDRPFELVAAPPEEPVAPLEAGRIDCVVCHSDGERGVAGFLDAVRAVSDAVPIVVLAIDAGVDPATAMAVATTYVDVGANLDPIDRLRDVAPIVERHRADVRERTMLDSLLANIPLSVYWKDRRSRHVKVSDAMPSMIGPDHIENPDGKRFHAPEDLVGTTDWDLYPPDLAANAVDDDRVVIDDEKPVVDRKEHSYGSRFDGTYVATSKAPWYDDRGRVAGLVGVTRDISERKQYEHQLERQNERLERFAEVLSHDLRNPLEVAQGKLALAREDDAEAHLGALERALERMDVLIEDVLTLAREGEVVADPEPVELASAAEAAWELVDADGADIVVETDAEILADPGRLQQILENCFRNAVEHGAEGGHLAVAVGELHQGFFVADDGPGIPADVREEVFEPGVSTRDDGTGLGLGIVRSIAEAHGWRVAATESDEGGARFEFEDVRRAP